MPLESFFRRLAQQESQTRAQFEDASQRLKDILLKEHDLGRYLREMEKQVRLLEPSFTRLNSVRAFERYIRKNRLHRTSFYNSSQFAQHIYLHEVAHREAWEAVGIRAQIGALELKNRDYSGVCIPSVSDIRRVYRGNLPGFVHRLGLVNIAPHDQHHAIGAHELNEYRFGHELLYFAKQLKG